MEDEIDQPRSEPHEDSSDSWSPEQQFEFLERQPGTGPDGPQTRHVELPYSSFSNGRYRTYLYEYVLIEVDIFFSSSHFSATVHSQDLDQILSTNVSETSTGCQVNISYSEKPSIRPFSCQCNPSCDSEGSTQTLANTIYHKLPHENAIRVLEVMRGDYCDSVVCKLHLVSLPEAAQTFLALSYTWRIDYTDQPPQSISCNGKNISIGKNLFDAIRRIRKPTSSQMIWADALCINQDDVEERSSQVSKMEEIFSSAYEVYAWLGEETLPGWTYPPFCASVALSDLCTIVNQWREQSGRSSIPKATFWSPNNNQMPRRVYDPNGYNQYWWEETLQFFRRRWFHRVWVIQEIALARSARILLGECEISWETVGLAASILRTNFNKLVPLIGQGHTRETLLEFRTGVINAYFMYRFSRCQSHVKRIEPDFHDLLILTRSFDCQDERDRIYGLLGLPFNRGSSSDLSPFIIPDYAKTTIEVYQEVAIKIFRDSGGLRLLSSIQRPSPHALNYDTFDDNAPSWIPQWSFTETQSLLPFEKTPGLVGPGNSIEFMPASSPTRLRVCGINITSVQMVSEVGKSSDFCIPWWVVTKGQGINVVGFEDGRQVAYPLESTGEITDNLLSRNSTQQNLIELAMILTAGKDWYGAPVENEAFHARDFMRLLLEGGLLWCFKDDAFGTEADDPMAEQRRLNKRYRKTISDAQFQQLSTSLGSFAQKGNATRFLDAAGTVGRGRRRFTTESGYRGIGPGAMQPGDRICILHGANVPFVLRCKESSYQVIGGCYLYVKGLVKGATIKEALQRGCGVAETWIELI